MLSRQIARVEKKTPAMTSTVPTTSQNLADSEPSQHASAAEWGAVFALIGPAGNETAQSASSGNDSATPAYSFSNASLYSDEGEDSGGYHWNSSKVRNVMTTKSYLRK